MERVLRGRGAASWAWHTPGGLRQASQMAQERPRAARGTRSLRDREGLKASYIITSFLPSAAQGSGPVPEESIEDLEAADREFERVSKLTRAIEQARKAIEALSAGRRTDLLYNNENNIKEVSS